MFFTNKFLVIDVFRWVNGKMHPLQLSLSWKSVAPFVIGTWNYSFLTGSNIKNSTNYCMVELYLQTMYIFSLFNHMYNNNTTCSLSNGPVRQYSLVNLPRFGVGSCIISWGYFEYTNNLLLKLVMYHIMTWILNIVCHAIPS